MQEEMQLKELMEQLENKMVALCDELKYDGQVELPLVALDDTPEAALVAAALNRHLPLKSFTLLSDETADISSDLAKIIEFLGTVHTTIKVPAAALAANSRELWAAEARRLGYDHFYSGALLKEAGNFSAVQIAALMKKYLPCLK